MHSYMATVILVCVWSLNVKCFILICSSSLIAVYMFTNSQRQVERTGKYGTPRVQYLQVNSATHYIDHLTV